MSLKFLFATNWKELKCGTPDMSLSLQINEVLRQFEQISTYDHVNDSKTDHPRCKKLDLRKADFIVPNARKHMAKKRKAWESMPRGTWEL